MSQAQAAPRASSDYGSDLDAEGEEELCLLLEDIEVRRRALLPSLVFGSQSEHVAPSFAIRPVGARQGLRALRDAESQDEPCAVELDDESFGIDLTAIAQNPVYESPKPPSSTTHLQDTSMTKTDENGPDTRSPLTRFRSKKPLSVTDLISPAWCELQYSYTLSTHGRKKRTPAMKAGTTIHKALEAQVHDFVPIDVQTREDMWGLRIWNIIQGLRTLKATGMTRELEVWGQVDGEVVNGVIDELSFTCSDPEMEARLSGDGKKKKEEEETDASQARISQFFQSSSSNGVATGMTLQTTANATQLPQTICITDVKTRASSTLPSASSLRPTHMQLSIYRSLLSSLASNLVPADAVFSRYRLNPDIPFSDSLIAQLGSLDLNFTSESLIASTHDSPDGSSPDIITEIIMHNSLRLLWALMITAFQSIIPSPCSTISPILRAEFRSSTKGTVIGSKSFLYDEKMTREYMKDEMAWWKGEREARGVEVEEAFKCRMCEFAEGCSWRVGKIEEAVKKARAGKGG